MFELAMVNKPSVFELLRFDCSSFFPNKVITMLDRIQKTQTIKRQTGQNMEKKKQQATTRLQKEHPTYEPLPLIEWLVVKSDRVKSEKIFVYQLKLLYIIGCIE